MQRDGNAVAIAMGSAQPYGVGQGTVERHRLPDLPAHVGPCEFCEQGRQVIVRGIGPVIRALEYATDPLFWRAGIDLDGDD
jgi:hypothetical protein